MLAESVPIAQLLEQTFEELERVVDQEETLVTIERLGELFDEARTLAEEVVPAQTVCNYWNYWFTFLPEHLSERDQVGFNQRIALLLPPLGTVSINIGGVDVNITEDQLGGVANYSGIQSDAKAGPSLDVEAPVDLPPVGEPGTTGVYKPHELATLHGPPYGIHGEERRGRLHHGPDRLPARRHPGQGAAEVEPGGRRRRLPGHGRADDALLQPGLQP